MNGQDLLRIANLLKASTEINFNNIPTENDIGTNPTGYYIDFNGICAHFPFNPIKEYIQLYYGTLRKAQAPKLAPHLVNDWVKVWFRNNRTVFQIGDDYFSAVSTPETNKAFMSAFG